MQPQPDTSSHAPLGVVLWENPETLAGAAICIDDEGPRRITRPGALDSSITWWSNLEYEHYRRHQAYNWGAVRNSQFLRGRISSLLSELGLLEADLVTQAEVLYDILQHVGHLTREWYGIRIEEHQRLDWALKTVLLKRGQPLAGELAPVAIAARDAHSYIVITPMRPAAGERGRTYQIPRMPAVRNILELPFPMLREPWEHVTLEAPISAEAFLSSEALAGRDLAGFVRLRIRDLDDELADCLPFSKQGGGRREWATLPELMFYVEHAQNARILVQEAWITQGAPIDLGKPLLPDELEFSFSAGLLSEAVLFALAGMPNQKQRSIGHEAIAAYATAYDRILCASAALGFYREGYAPKFLGALRVVVNGLEADYPDLDALALEMNLEPPMRVMEDQA